jgi:Lrp/AsnC family transcriptional regulator, leucine-responsive regulatory protein
LSKQKPDRVDLEQRVNRSKNRSKTNSETRSETSSENNSVDRSVNKSANKSVDRAADQPINKPLNKLVNQANRQVEPLQPLDGRDRLLLQLLQENSRISNAALARQLHLTAPGLQKRLKKLEDNGFIDRYVTLINREALGLALLCFAEVTLARHQSDCVGQFCERVQGLPEVLECHHLTGEFDYLLKVVVPDHQHLERLVSETITQIPGVETVRTNIVLNEVKASTSLPVKE